AERGTRNSRRRSLAGATLSALFRVPTAAFRVDRAPPAIVRLRDASAPRWVALVRSGVRTDPASWKDERHKRGLVAEQQAMRYLQSQGWVIAAHRFRVGHT